MRYLANKEHRITSRWIPDNAVKFEHPDGLAVVYCYGTAERPMAVCYIGTSSKSAWHNRFSKQSDRDAKIISTFKGLSASAKMKADLQQERTKPHNLKVGEIVYNSWGYDQTNVDWYRIIRVSDNYVWLVEIAAHVIEDSFMAGPSQPHVETSSENPSEWGFSNLKDATETKHRVYVYGNGGVSINFKHGAGSKWDGQPVRCSWYA